jgi:hypothetical protein
MDVVQNEITKTIHKREKEGSHNQTACGVTRNTTADKFQVISVDLATTEYDSNKCGRCFDDAGGY